MQNRFPPQVIKNKFTGEPASYGFINFDSDPAALMAMHKLNGKIIPNSTPVSQSLPSLQVESSIGKLA